MESTLDDLEKISSNCFIWDNSFRLQRVVPALSIEGNRIRVAASWQLVGYTDGDVPGGDRDGQLAIMLHHEEHGELWQHFPMTAAKEFVFVSSQ